MPYQQTNCNLLCSSAVLQQSKLFTYRTNTMLNRLPGESRVLKKEDLLAVSPKEGTKRWEKNYIKVLKADQSILPGCAWFMETFPSIGRAGEKALTLLVHWVGTQPPTETIGYHTVTTLSDEWNLNISSHLLSFNSQKSSPRPLPTSLSPHNPCSRVPHSSPLTQVIILWRVTNAWHHFWEEYYHHASCSLSVVTSPHPDWGILREGRFLLLYQLHPAIQKTVRETAHLHWYVDMYTKLYM